MKLRSWMMVVPMLGAVGGDLACARSASVEPDVAVRELKVGDAVLAEGHRGKYRTVVTKIEGTKVVTELGTFDRDDVARLDGDIRSLKAGSDVMLRYEDVRIKDQTQSVWSGARLKKVDGDRFDVENGSGEIETVSKDRLAIPAPNWAARIKRENDEGPARRAAGEIESKKVQERARLYEKDAARMRPPTKTGWKPSDGDDVIVQRAHPSDERPDIYYSHCNVVSVKASAALIHCDLDDDAEFPLEKVLPFVKTAPKAGDYAYTEADNLGMRMYEALVVSIDGATAHTIDSAGGEHDVPVASLYRADLKP